MDKLEQAAYDFMNRVLSDAEQGQAEYEKMAAENAKERERIRASIEEKRERFAKKRSASGLKSRKVQDLEMRWELLKFELELKEQFYDRIDSDEINIIHDIQSLMSKIEKGEA